MAAAKFLIEWMEGTNLLGLWKIPQQNIFLVRIVRKETKCRDPSPLFKQQLSTSSDKEWAKVLIKLLQANARWNEERMKAAQNNKWKIVDMTRRTNPKFQRQQLFSWENDFTNHKSAPRKLNAKKNLTERGWGWKNDKTLMVF